MDLEPTVYRREELYEQVWSAPMRQVAKQYGVSDVALGKICRKLDIPVPGRGYWARKAAGRTVERKPLLPAKERQPTEYHAQQCHHPPDESALSPETKRLLERERDASMKITVEEKLTNPHPLTRKSAPLLRKAAKGRAQVLDLLRTQQCLDIVAVGESLERALRIMDALLKALERRGFEVDVTAPVPPNRMSGDYSRQEGKPSITRIRLGDSFIEFGLEEGFDTVKIEPEPPKRTSRRFESVWTLSPRPQYEQRPTGKLTLRIKNHHHPGARQSWGDGKKQRVEDCLDAAVIGFINAAEYESGRRHEAERRERERIEDERRRVEAARRRALEAALAYDLDSRISDWVQARAIRQFAAAVEEQARLQATDLSPDSELGRWLAWARNRAQLLDAGAIATVLELRRPPSTPPVQVPRW